MKSQDAVTDATPIDLGLNTPIEHRWIDVGEVTLHVALAGPETGRPLILLHGFPEAWFGWRHQIDALVGAGFRLAIPDQRGYNLSEKPAGVKAYALPRLAADVAGLATALGWTQYRVIGHDWGAAVVWQLVETPPPGLLAAAVINVPELRVMLRHVYRTRQFFRSLYILFFQLPWLPEWALCRKNGEILAQRLVDSSKPGTFGPEELEGYRRAWARPGAMQAQLGWYRSGARRPPPKRRQGPVEVPMLILWGEQDQFLGKEMVSPSAACVRHVEVVRFPDATHWVAHEEPAAVNAALVDFFGRQDAPPTPPG